VAYELLSGKPPYHKYAHDNILVLRIRSGLRTNLEEVKIPQLLKDLIIKC